MTFNVCELQISFSRFGVIIALMAKQEIQPGEEFLSDYNYKFDSAPRWYKDLFLRFMSNHPEDIGTIQRITMGRSRSLLNIAYQVNLKQGVNLNRTQTADLGEIVGHETN